MMDSNSLSKSNFHRWAAILLALFLVRTLDWAYNSELWYDEVLSLQLFVLRPDSLWEVFRDYRIANNHFLANAIEWLWVRGCGVPINQEYLLRLPALVCGLGTIATIIYGWRAAIGDKMALTVATLFALSPVFAPFAFQMRGYSLAMFLTTVAVTLALRRENQATIGNSLGLFTVSLLLPLTMPSAAMAPCAIAVGAAVNAWWNEGKFGIRGICSGMQSAWPPLAGAVVGTAYYLTLWEEFTRATRESGGWESAWAVAGNVALAFALHLGMLLYPLMVTPARRSRLTAPQRAALWQLAGAVLAVVVILLLPSPIDRSPFPRVFIVLLPIVSLAAARLHGLVPKLEAMRLPRLLLLVAVPAMLITWATGLLTLQALRSGEAAPQNLLQQYYRESCGVREAVNALTKRGYTQAVIVVDAVMEPTFAYYWQLAGQKIVHDDGVPAVIAENRLSRDLRPIFVKHPLFCFTTSSSRSRELAQKVGISAENAPSVPLSMGTDGDFPPWFLYGTP